MSEEDDEGKKNQTAEDVAAAMVENMKKNMEDPDFLDKKELMLDEVRNDVLKKLEKRLNKLESE